MKIKLFFWINPWKTILFPVLNLTVGQVRFRIKNICHGYFRLWLYIISALSWFLFYFYDIDAEIYYTKRYNIYKSELTISERKEEVMQGSDWIRRCPWRELIESCKSIIEINDLLTKWCWMFEIHVFRTNEVLGEVV